VIRTVIAVIIRSETMKKEKAPLAAGLCFDRSVRRWRV
jgi:hypothetical protein